MRKQMILTATFVHLQSNSHVASSSDGPEGARWLSFRNEPDDYNTPLHLFLPSGSDPADMARLATLFNEIIAKAAKAEAA